MSIQANIALRAEAAEVVALIGNKPPHFWHCLAELAREKVTPIPQAAAKPQPAARKGITIPLADSRCDPDEALELIAEIEELAEQVPERGREFAESAVETAKSIGETIEQRQSVTPSQYKALENIEVALSNWLHD